MAYQSKVTNKYFGTTFAGGGKVGVQETELSGLVKALGQVTPQLQEMGNQYIKTQEQDAAQEIQRLDLQGKSTEEIKKIIDSGKNEELNSMYASATNNLWLGKLTANEDMLNIQESLAEYNPDTQSMEEFINSKITADFDNADKFFAGGYAAEFNEKKAALLDQDAKNRYKVATERKIQGLARYIGGQEPTTKLADGTTITYYDRIIDNGTYSRSQINQATLQYVAGGIATATTVAELNDLEEYLLTDRGTGKQGMKLGSLVSAKNPQALEMMATLRNKRQDLIQRGRAESDYIRAKVIQDSFTMVAKGEITSKEEYRKYLISKDAFSVEAMKTYDDITSQTTYFASQTQVDEFILQVAGGVYKNKTYAQLMKDAKEMGIDPTNPLIYTHWERASKGVDPIYISDKTIAREIESISSVLSATGLDGEFNPTIKMRIDRFLQAEVELWYFEEPERTNDDVKNYIRDVLQPRVDRIISKGGFGSPDNEAYAPLTGGQKDIIKGQTQLGIDTAENIEEVQTFREKYMKGEESPTSAESVRTAAAEAIKTSETNKMIDDFMEGLNTSDDIDFKLPVYDKTDFNINRLFNPRQGFQEQEVYPAVLKAFADLTGVTTQKEFDDLFASFDAEGVDRVEELITTLSQKLDIDPELLKDSLDFFGENLANLAEEQRMRKFRGGE